jgi:hypothetical protein
MMNLNKTKLMVLAIVFGSIMSSCSSYNHINYRNEKQVASKQDKQIDKETIAELPIEQGIELGREIILPTGENETLVNPALVAGDQGLVLVEKNKKKSFTAKLADIKGPNNIIANLIEKVSDHQVKTSIKTSDESGKSQPRKLYDIFFWIMVALTIVVAVLMITGTYLAFAGSIINPFYLMVPAFVLFLFGYVLLILLNFVLPKKIDNAEKDSAFGRKKTFSMLTFIMACIPLGALLIIGLSYLIQYIG